MDPTQQSTAFEQIANKAKRAGLLRYHKHGVIVLTLPEPATGLAKRVAPATPPAPPVGEPPAPIL